MWIEIANEIFNFSRIVSVCRVGDFDIALYEKVEDLDEYLLISFDSWQKRDACFEYIKKTLGAIKYGQENKKD